MSFIGLDAHNDLDDFLLDGEAGGVKGAGKSCPGYALPDDGAALPTVHRFKIFSHN
jgi:hypothetical protein